MPTRRLNRSIEEKRVQTIEEKRSPAVLQDGEKIKMQMVRVMRGYIVVNH
jgi:Fe-S cluster biogenesis protein NfuA